MKLLIAALLASTVVTAAHAEPIAVGSVVRGGVGQQTFACATAAGVETARKQIALVVKGAIKGCRPLDNWQPGTVLAIDKKTGIMKIGLIDTSNLTATSLPQVFTTVSGWVTTRIDE